MPGEDGVRMLRRFTAKQPLGERLVFPPPSLRRGLAERFHSMELECQRHLFGREVKLRANLLELIVDLVRWEQRSGRPRPTAKAITTWQPLDLALQYLRTHYAEPIYASDLAQAAGVSKSRLKDQFHQGLGMPWSRYLQCYRVHMAAAMLNEPHRQVTETAFAVGFESLSHFNTTFRAIMGVSPGAYAKRTKGR
jgi:AraC-like DNA-binding protein